MLENSDFLVEGKCFITTNIKPKQISGINYRIETLMYNKFYLSENPTPFYFNEIFFTNTFYLEIPKEIPLSFKLKKTLGFMSKEEFLRKRYLLNLQRTRNELPYRVIFSISSAKKGNNNGFLISVRTEPIIIFKKAQLGLEYNITDSDYKNIIDTNKNFIIDIMNALGFEIVEKPRVTEDSSNLKKVITLTPTLFKVPDKPIRKDCVSVMMPFEKDFDNVFEAIKSACSNVNMSCKRAKDIWKDSLIIQDVFELIYRSSIVIVDFSGKNPNVFYESGIAHTLGKDVIPISQQKDIPFDLQHHRILPYLNNNEGLIKLSEGLEERLRILKNK